MIYNCCEADICFRFPSKVLAESQNLKSSIDSNELLFIAVTDGSIQLFAGYNNTSYILESGESISLFYPMQDWDFSLKRISSGNEIFVLKINLVLLHELLSGEKDIALKKILQHGDYYGGKGFSGEKMILTPMLKLLIRQMEEFPVGLNTIKPFIRAKIVELFSILLDSRVAPTSGQSCPFFGQTEIRNRMLKIKEFLTLNPEEELALEKFSEEYKMSKHALRIGFKKIFEKSIKDYCLNMKMERALEMLQAGGMKVSDVAYQTGYSNPSHFISIFKRRFGSSPGSFLKVKE